MPGSLFVFSSPFAMGIAKCVLPFHSGGPSRHVCSNIVDFFFPQDLGRDETRRFDSYKLDVYIVALVKQHPLLIFLLNKPHVTERDRA